MNTRLRPAGPDDAAQVLRWRNHPEVRRVMFTDHVISEAEHAAWWRRVATDADTRLLIVVHGGRDCGVVTFHRCADEAGAWMWGFYLDPEGFDDGVARLRAWNGMQHASLDWARSELAADTVRCEVFAFNTAVLQMHLRHRFSETGRYLRPRGNETLEVIQLARKA